jgi:predicted nucleic acid-binding protein
MTDGVLVDQRYYFDANALIKYYTKEPGSLQISRLVSNAKPILISPLTLIESINVLAGAGLQPAPPLRGGNVYNPVQHNEKTCSGKIREKRYPRGAGEQVANLLQQKVCNPVPRGAGVTFHFLCWTGFATPSPAERG